MERGIRSNLELSPVHSDVSWDGHACSEWGTHHDQRIKNIGFLKEICPQLLYNPQEMRDIFVENIQRKRAIYRQ